LVLIALAVSPAVTAAGRRNEPTDLYDQATSAFGLGRYDEAAQKYEEAFSLQPDPVLLYNAAQSYRLAGNKTRALELYRNLLRIYPDFVSAEKAREHIAALQKDVADGQKGPAVPPPPAPVQTVPQTTSVLTGSPSVPAVSTSVARGDESVFKKGWFWAVAGAVVVAGTVGVLLATRGTKYPDATFGMVNGN
jgi:tetratricopeptide (TPR) repeat protein